jgi:hypothetical protein
VREQNPCGPERRRTGELDHTAPDEFFTLVSDTNVMRVGVGYVQYPAPRPGTRPNLNVGKVFPKDPDSPSFLRLHLRDDREGVPQQADDERPGVRSEEHASPKGNASGCNRTDAGRDRNAESPRLDDRHSAPSPEVISVPPSREFRPEWLADAHELEALTDSGESDMLSSSA